MTINQILLNEGTLAPKNSYYKIVKNQTQGKLDLTNKDVKYVIDKIYEDIEESDLRDNIKGDFAKLVFTVWLKDAWRLSINKIKPYAFTVQSLFTSGTARDGVDMYYRYGSDKNFMETPEDKKKFADAKKVFTMPLGHVNLEYGVVSFHDIVNNRLLSKGGGSKNQLKGKSFKSVGKWKIFHPKTFEEAKAMSSITDPKNPDNNRKAKWCTAASKGYFNTYENIYIIKKEPSDGDEGVMLQMNWGAGSKQSFNFKNEEDRGFELKELKSYNIPKEILSAIKAPDKKKDGEPHEFAGKSLNDVVTGAEKSLSSMKDEIPKVKNRKKGAIGKTDWVKKDYDNTGVSVETIKNKLTANIPGFEFDVTDISKIFTDSGTSIEQVARKKPEKHKFQFDYTIIKSPSQPDLVFLRVRGIKNTTVGMDSVDNKDRMIRSDAYRINSGHNEHFGQVYMFNTKTQRSKLVKKGEIYKNKKITGFPMEVFEAISGDSKEKQEQRKGGVKILRKGHIGEQKIIVTEIKNKSSLKLFFTSSLKPAEVVFDKIKKEAGKVYLIRTTEKARVHFYNYKSGSVLSNSGGYGGFHTVNSLRVVFKKFPKAHNATEMRANRKLIKDFIDGKNPDLKESVGFELEVLLNELTKDKMFRQEMAGISYETKLHLDGTDSEPDLIKEFKRVFGKNRVRSRRSKKSMISMLKSKLKGRK
jgi:hypothetical protein